jgi:hypothetical protein
MEIQKKIWTSKDFELMAWHDCPIHGFGFQNGDNYTNSELILDIDYIFQWVKLKSKNRFKFLIAPCTLVFKEVLDLVVDIVIIPVQTEPPIPV